MLNQSGITATSYTSDKQILANVELQASVGCIVPVTMGVTSGTKKIVFAGTPIKIDFDNIQTPAVVGDGTNAMNAVLLHNVDVTNGAANGTALIFGFVNKNRLEASVKTLVTAAVANASASNKITFLTV